NVLPLRFLFQQRPRLIGLVTGRIYRAIVVVERNEIVAALPEMRHGGRVNNGIQPGREPGLSLKVPQIPERLQKTVLSDLLGVLTITRKAQGKSEHVRLMPCYQCFISAPLALESR